jgi:hypothetical protein
MADGGGGSKTSPPGYFLDGLAVGAGKVHGMDGVRVGLLREAAFLTGCRGLDFRDGNTRVPKTGKTAASAGGKAIAGRGLF